MARALGLGLACFALVVAAASATQFRVGGQKGWSVPGDGFEPYNTWAGRLRFLIDDQLLFVYPKETDSVLLVEPAAYNSCNVSSYLQKFDDGNTVVKLDRSGPFFFISGNEDSCRANEKLIVVVLADRTPPGSRTPPGAPPTTSPPSPSPVPSPSTPPPAAAPAPALSPSSPPPSGGGGAAPVPAPAATPTSPPSPAASAPAPGPTATPGSPPAPPMAPSPSSTTPGTPGGASQPPSASANAPGAGTGGNSTPPPPSSSDRGAAAAPAAAGFVASLGAFIGYAMLAA